MRPVPVLEQELSRSLAMTYLPGRSSESTKGPLCLFSITTCSMLAALPITFQIEFKRDRLETDSSTTLYCAPLFADITSNAPRKFPPSHLGLSLFPVQRVR